MIEVDDLVKRYGDLTAVDGVSLRVEAGEVFGILGPNGAGKTTIVECLQGLRPIDGGRVRVLGLDPGRHQRRLRPRIGSQLQESALPDRLRVGEALDLFASVHPGGSDRRHLLDAWGLGPVVRSSFASLSGGERQRLFVALALVNQPEVVFLDELTQGLDPGGRRVAWDLIRQVRDQGTTVVLVTHHLEEVDRLCDRAAIVDHGRIVAQGTPTQLAGLGGGTVTVRFSTTAGDLPALAEIAGVSSVTRHGDQVEVLGTGPVLALVAAALVEQGIVPEDLRAEHPSLEDVYLELTSRPPTPHRVGRR